jgi:hypothetical protein
MLLASSIERSSKRAFLAAILFCAGASFLSGAVARAATATSSDPQGQSGATSSVAVTTPATATTTGASASVPLVDTCGISKDDIAAIAAIQRDPSLSASEEIVQELALRKKLVATVITCAQGEVVTLRTAIDGAPDTGSAGKAIRTMLDGRLDDASNFYSLELGKLNNAGIAGTKAVAADVLSWRQGTFTPLVGQANNYVLWAGNQSLFMTAATRMAETQQAVSFLENASANSSLSNAFNAAYASFETAQSDNAAAQAALQQSLPPNETLTFIKQSLDALQSTYKQFFTLSTIIQALLPQ